MILVLSTTALAETTTYKWYPSATQFPLGDCVRMHAPTAGDAYVEKVKAAECKPEKVSFLWHKGACYVVDQATQGQTYGEKSRDVLPCAPADALHAFEAEAKTCYLVDPTGGSQFKARVSLDECRPEEAELTYEFTQDCFEVHKTLGRRRWEKKVKAEKCRPQKTTLAWRKTGDLKGDCWLVGENDSFAEKVSDLKCRPEQVRYRFVRKSEKAGDCFEVDAETQGDFYSKKVQAALCRNE